MSTNEPMNNGERPAGTQATEANLSEEFREFGRQLSALLRTIRESPRAKEIETQISQAMKDMERQMNQAMSTARERSQAQDWKGTIKGAATTAVDETQKGLAQGLHILNERMAKTVQDAEKNRPGSGGAGSSEVGGEGTGGTG